MGIVHVLAECRAHLFGEVLSDYLGKKKPLILLLLIFKNSGHHYSMDDMLK